jgi:Zn-dependent peptidase ImmA (M78 family)
MFTLAHELAHLARSIRRFGHAASLVPDHQVERWCNNVAAELLVPLEILKQEYDGGLSLSSELDHWPSSSR